ncbi:MAG: hypothetical protein M3Y55_12665 [Pseudomonadota bacterium]|nr:hypothetical protein [Pseudomonadota bacterium]
MLGLSERDRQRHGSSQDAKRRENPEVATGTDARGRRIDARCSDCEHGESSDKAWSLLTAVTWGTDISAGAPDGASYLTDCDEEAGHEVVQMFGEADRNTSICRSTTLETDVSIASNCSEGDVGKTTARSARSGGEPGVGNDGRVVEAPGGLDWDLDRRRLTRRELKPMAVRAQQVTDSVAWNDADRQGQPTHRPFVNRRSTVLGRIDAPWHWRARSDLWEK